MADMEIEVFATGKHGGLQWGPEHLDQMVANFAKLSGSIKPPLKLGHTNKQIIAQQDGQPALGWVAGLRRAGDKLIATVKDVPQVLRELIARGRYKRVSSEIYPRWELTSYEKNLASGASGSVLSAVALLGADVPEVKNLEDLGKLLQSEGITAAVTLCECDTQATACTQDCAVQPPLFVSLSHPRTAAASSNPTGVEDDEMDVKELQEQVAKLTQAVADRDAADAARATKLAEDQAALKASVDAKDAEIKRLAEENKAIQAREAAAQVRADATAAQTFAELQVSKRRLFPGQVVLAQLLHRHLAGGTALVTAAEATEAKLFAQGETARDLTLRECFEQFVAAYPEQKFLNGEQAQAGDPAASDDAQALQKAMAEKAKELGKDLGKYDERNAVVAALRANPTTAALFPKYGREAA